jgi:hypothetical protein
VKNMKTIETPKKSSNIETALAKTFSNTFLSPLDP